MPLAAEWVHLVVRWASLHVEATVVASLLSIYLIPGFIRITVPFRGLLVPSVPRNPHVKLRVALRINSYLPRWTGAVTFLGTWGIGIALTYGIIKLFGIAPNNALIGIFISLFLVFLVPAYAVWAWHFYHDVLTKEQARIQRRRDRRAAEIVTMARRSSLESNRYSVWLRPFNSTGRCWVIARSREYKFKTEGDAMAGWHLEFTDLETLLAAVIEAIAPLIALGTSGEQVGAGRVDTTERSWRGAYILLARSAHAVFLLPSLQSGTQWELKFLLNEQELIRRVIFVIPPDTLDKLVERSWEDLVVRGTMELAGSQKVTFPKFSAIGKSTARYRHETSEMRAAREGALQAFERILKPDDYGKVRDATDGALIQLSNDPWPKIVAMAKLRTAYAGFPFHYNWGPRFVQQQFRKQVLGILSGWSPKLVGCAVHERLPGRSCGFGLRVAPALPAFAADGGASGRWAARTSGWRALALRQRR